MSGASIYSNAALFVNRYIKLFLFLLVLSVNVVYYTDMSEMQINHFPYVKTGAKTDNWKCMESNAHIGPT